MALDALEARIANNRDKAGALNNALISRLGGIRANPNLSLDGKRAQVARAYLETSGQIDALKADEQNAIAAKQTDLNRSVFGIYASDPMSVIAFRDAQDRAGRLTKWQDAAALLASSALASDSTLAAAVMARALAEGWSEVINSYIDTHPTQADALSDLQDLGKFTSTRQNQLFNFMAYVIPPIAEINNLMPYQIEALASGTGA